MTKKGFTLLLILFITVTSINAQTSWGIKGSLLYNSNGELLDDAEKIIDDKGKGETGYNIGIYGKLDLGPLFIRPELVYSKASSQYLIEPELGTTQPYNTTSIDLPILVGIKIIGPLNLMAGPAFKFTTSNELNGIDGELDKNITVGLNIGVSANIGRLGFDVIYDRGINANEAEFIGNDIVDEFILDSRQSQIRVGVSYRLSATKE